MRILVFPNILHGGQIHSIDISGDNSKLLTGGVDHKVSLWNADDFIIASRDDNLKERELLEHISPLCEFESHASAVNVVQWSPNCNQTFITGDVRGNLYMHCLEKDEHILIYPYWRESEATSSIVDLSWSIDGRLIAWSTQDCRVHLYDISRKTYQELLTPSQTEELSIQRSIKFDPSNNYMVSIGDDSLVSVFQYDYEKETGNYRFRLIHKISKLINKTSLKMKYRRIDWSPDGEYITVPTASNNQTSLISLLSRSEDWDNVVGLVGHDLNCESIKYNPQIFKATNSTSDIQLYNIIATGGSDMSLVLWNTSKDNPILILKELTSKAIVDLSWNKEGNILFVASLEGRLTVVSFESQELGYEVDRDNFNKLEEAGRASIKPLDRKIELDSTQTKKSSNNYMQDIVSQKKAVDIEKEKISNHYKEEESIDTEKETQGTSKSWEQSSENALPPRQHNGSDIAPEVILAPSLDELNSNNDDILMSAMESRAKRATGKAERTSSQVEKSKTSEKTKVTIKDGKKRIQPNLISSSNGNYNDKNMKAETSKQQLPISNTLTSNKTLMEFEKPSYSVSDELYKQSKRKNGPDEALNKKVKREMEPIKFIGSPILNPNTSFARVRLATPRVRQSFQVSSNANDSERCILDIKNGSGDETRPSRITFFRGEKLLCSDFTPALIPLVSEGSFFWSVSTTDGQILTYSRASGKRILPPLALGCALSFLECYDDYLMAVTSIGELFVWDIKKRKSILQSPLSISSLLELHSKYQEDGLSKSDNITMCSITSKGIPLITLSNGSGYLFNKDLGTWQTISESWWAFGSHYWDSMGSDFATKMGSSSFNGNNDTSVVTLLENKTNELIIRKSRAGRGKYFNKMSKNMLMKEGFENLENTISMAHMENRILCCELLGESKEFRNYLITFARRICELGLKTKFFEICSDLLGPLRDETKLPSQDDDSTKPNWSETVCGIKKHDLLKEIVLACAHYRNCQRILLYFSEKIGILSAL